MADFWQIQGQAGKSLDATVRDMTALGYAGGRCFFDCYGIDEFTFSKVLDGLAPSGEILPENNQTVTLYRNGARYFHGRAIVKQAGRTVSVTVYGPGWEAEAIPYVVASADQSGVSKTRPYAKMAAATLSSMLTTVVNASAGLGVPWQLGTVPTTWNSGQLTLQQLNCLPAITEIGRYVADMMQWVDYSTTPPTVHFSRRLTGLGAGTAVTRTIDAETLDADDSGFEVAPMMQKRVEQVRVAYVSRNAGGRRTYQEQAAGTPATARVQWLTWSGPELDSYLPPEGGSSFVVQTTDANVSLNTIKPYLMAMMPEVQKVRAQYGGLPQDTDVRMTNGETLEYHIYADWGVVAGHDGLRYYTTPALRYLDANTNAPVSVVGKHLVITANPPDWLTSMAGFQKVKVTGWLFYPVAETLKRAPSYVLETDAPDPPAWFNGLSWTAYWEFFGYSEYSNVTYNRALYSLYSYAFEIEAYLSTTAYPSGQTFSEPADFNWNSMPAGFADGMLAAQNWTPYEGVIAWTDHGGEAGGTRYRGCVVNVTNALPELATMRAMVKSEEVQLETGRTVLRLGAPERLSFAQVMDMYRRNSSDNITVS